MSPARPETVVVSAGFAKTHVTTAAAEASARSTLAVCITGAYPTPRISRVVRLLRLRRGRLARLFERAERIPPERLRSQLLPELLYDLGRFLGRVPLLGRVHGAICAATWRLYGRRAERVLRRRPSTRIYHFRAGFGQSSVHRAKADGIVTLCDYALAHPSVLDEVVAGRGRIPRGADLQGRPPADPLGKTILTDIEAADELVVNSHFVKETFLATGWRPERIHVIYLGVDDNFLEAVSVEPRETPEGRLRLLFAGLLDRRKGAEELIEALRGLQGVDWELRVAGPVAPETRAAHGHFLDDERVTELGVLSRPDLAREMLAAPVFVFPSLAEGSARVVFEALACGCYVITTPNAGSIVEDGVHGSVVPPGDAFALREAIAAADSNRSKLAEVGNRNSTLIRESYTQSAYGERLDALYEELSSAAEAR